MKKELRPRAWWKFIRQWIFSHSRFLILGGVSLGIIIFWLWLERQSSVELNHQKQVGAVFQSFAVGVGALLSGAAAFKYLEDWLSKQKLRNAEKKTWRERFPTERLGQDFKIVQSKGTEGVLYIWDLKSNKRHWIVDPATLRWLGLSYADLDTLPTDKFLALKRGENIQFEP